MTKEENIKADIMLRYNALTVGATDKNLSTFPCNTIRLSFWTINLNKHKDTFVVFFFLVVVVVVDNGGDDNDDDEGEEKKVEAVKAL